MKKKLYLLKLKSDYQKGIALIKKYLENHQTTIEVQLELVFFLYHYAASFYGKKNLSLKQRKKVKKYFNQAIKICQEILKTNKDNLNARIYLAQIYAILKNKKAINLAKKNYRLHPNFVTANRLADVYNRLNQNKKALYWYRLCEKLCRGKNCQLFTRADLAIFYKKINKKELAEKYAREILKLAPYNSMGESIIKIIKKHFPYLKAG